MNSKKRLTKLTLAAAILALTGVGRVWADGVVTVIGAAGGQAIPADTAGGAWTTLSGPKITNLQSDALAGSGTLVLTAPAGFQFNSNAVVTLLLAQIGDIKNGGPSWVTLPVQVTPTDLTVTIQGMGACILSFQNIQVRPTAGSPLASGYITQSGTQSYQNINHLYGDWGFLQEVAGTLVGYVITGTNYSTAGSPISITIQKVDQFGNPLNDSTTENLVFSGIGTIGTNAPTINGSTDAFTTGIPVSFNSNGTATVTLIDYLAGTGTLNISDGTYTDGSGLTITVAAGPASVLNIQSAPASVTYGSSFGLTVETTDQYGNLSTTGLGASVPVTLTLASGPGTLTGNLSQDIGASAGNGTASFSGIQATAVGNNDVLSVSAAGFTPGTATLSIIPLVVSPNIQAKNKIYDGATGALILSRSLAGVIGSDDVSLGASGVASFGDKRAGNGKPVAVTGLALSGSAAGNYRLSTTSVGAAANIMPRALAVSATGINKVYDGTTSATVTLSDNQLAGDTLTVTYAAASFSDPNVGTGKPVQVSGISVTGPDAGNYTPNSSTMAMENITSASSTTAVSSSPPSIVEGSSVSFTATISPAGAASTVPTGTVQFSSNGQPLGSPVALNAGVATLTTSQLSAGSNTVMAAYLGDVNFQGSSASLVEPVQMNISTLTILSIVRNGDGTTTVTCQGVPDTDYVVQAAPTMNLPVAWGNFSTNRSGFIDGKWTFVDDMTQHTQRYFRAVKF
jgi:hypothetical protein